MLMQYGGSSKSTALMNAMVNGNTSSSVAVVAATGTNTATTAWPEHYLQFDDAMDMELLLSIHQHIQQEIVETKRRLIDCETQVVDAQLGYSVPAPGAISSTKASSSTKNKQQAQTKSTSSSSSKKDVKQEAASSATTQQGDETNKDNYTHNSVMDVDDTTSIFVKQEVPTVRSTSIMDLSD